MKKASITSLFMYPIKSSKGINIKGAKILETGFEFDRSFAVINSNNKIITARENSKLLNISTAITHKKLTLSHSKKETLEVDLTTINNKPLQIGIFKKDTYGKLINTEVDKWLSDILEEPCRLITIDSDNLRKVEDDNLQNKIALTDAYPIHLVTSASIKHLNDLLENPIKDNRFRPNIIISGTKPFEEENWKSITIGACEFEVVKPTERCSLITINPSSLEKDKQQEPLRTLAKNKREYKKVNFGIYLVPKNSGTINITDTIKMI